MVDLFASRGLPHIPHPPLADMFEIAVSGCWEWQGFVNPDGYGRVHTGGRRYGGHQMIHRVFYEALVESSCLGALWVSTKGKPTASLAHGIALELAVMKEADEQLSNAG